MEEGKRARNRRDQGEFDSAWMESIEAETARLAWGSKLPEDRVGAVAQEVAVTLWRRVRRSPAPEPGARSPEPGALSLTTSRGSSLRKSARNCARSVANERLGFR
jgi:hypothetical protein